MILTSAPGKVILFGEHAVVYGEPAIAGAIERRVYVQAKLRNDKEIKIFSSEDITDEFRYVKKAAEIAFDYLGKNSGLELKINSEVPIASGLGSSASVSVATILAISRLLEYELSKKEIATLGHRTESELQGAASITDTATATHGGVLFIQPKTEKFEVIDAALPLIVGYTGDARSTGELVMRVRERREKYPEIIDPIIKDIGAITRDARKKLENSEDIGELMNINHGLLEALGVSTEKLSRLVHAARSAGAKGAKITGAGGGGCMLAYTPINEKEVMEAIERQGCMALKAGITKEGVRVEREK